MRLTLEHMSQFYLCVRNVILIRAEKYKAEDVREFAIRSISTGWLFADRRRLIIYRCRELERNFTSHWISSQLSDRKRFEENTDICGCRDVSRFVDAQKSSWRKRAVVCDEDCSRETNNARPQSECFSFNDGLIARRYIQRVWKRTRPLTRSIRTISQRWRTSRIDSPSSWGALCWSNPCWGIISWWPLWVVPNPTQCLSLPLVQIWGREGIMSHYWALSPVLQRIMVFTNLYRPFSRWFTIHHACVYLSIWA